MADPMDLSAIPSGALRPRRVSNQFDHAPERGGTDETSGTRTELTKIIR